MFRGPAGGQNSSVDEVSGKMAECKIETVGKKHLKDIQEFYHGLKETAPKLAALQKASLTPNKVRTKKTFLLMFLRTNFELIQQTN